MAGAREVRDLTCDESFRSAAGKIIWTRFDEMMSFREAAVKGRDPEGVHDMRVASRRLRAALELFRDVFPAARFRPMLTDVKLLADALGEVRDTDVMIERLEADMTGRPLSERQTLQEMVDELRRNRSTARANLKATLAALDEADFARRFIVMIVQETA